MEIVSKDDDLAHSMSDCFVGEEVLLVLFYGSLQSSIKNYLKIIVHNLILKFSENIYPISRFSKPSKTKLWLSQYFCLFVYQCFFLFPFQKTITTTTIDNINETKWLRQMPLFIAYGPRDLKLFSVNITIDVPWLSSISWTILNTRSRRVNFKMHVCHSKKRKKYIVLHKL